MNNKTENILKAPLINPVNLKKLDSKNIVTAVQYQLLINLNLTLLEYDKDTNLVTLLADDYDIKDNSIVFQLKKGIKTAGGHEIKGIDAEVSLKRLILSSGSHSRLSELLCTQECQGIHSNGHELTLIAKKKSYIPFILALLTSADNVIFPLTALSNSTPNAEISNFHETSGPYLIESKYLIDEDLNEFRLKANTNNFKYQSNMAKEIIYTVAKYEDLVKNNSLINAFNYIHNVSGLKLDQIKELSHKESNVEVHSTAMLKNTIILMTNLGHKNFTPEELINYSLQIRDTLLLSKEAYPNIIQTQTEYFPSGADGQLSKEQLEEVNEKYLEILKHKKNSQRRIRFGVYPLFYEKYKNALSGLSNVEVVKIINSGFGNNTDNIDMFLDTIDSSFIESLDLLEYNKTFGIFDVSDEEIKKFIDSETRDERIKILRDVHYRSLIKGRFVMIGIAPYYTILSKAWNASPPTYSVGFPAWKITKKI